MRKARNLLITKLKASQTPLMPRLEIPIALISFGASDYFLIPYLKNCFLADCVVVPRSQKARKREKQQKETNRKDRFHKIQYRFQSKRNKICVLLVADQLQIFSKSLQTDDSSNISFYNNWIKLEGIMVNRTASQKDL